MLRNERGSVIIWLAAGFIVLLGFAGLVVDGGNMYLCRTRLVRAADAAALAAVWELPASAAEAQEKALEYAEKNGVDRDRVTVNIGDTSRSVTVKTEGTIIYYFARVFGHTGTTVEARSRASVGMVGGMTGVVPLGVEESDFTFGQTVVLKEGGGDGTTGNYGALALGGTGASTYETNLKFGFNQFMQVGDWIDTETGNMAGKTETGLNYRLNNCIHGCDHLTYVAHCPRLVYIPVLGSFDVSGRDEVEVVGFAAFFLDSVGSEDKKAVISGKFIQTMAPGEVSDSAPDYGLRAIQLTE